MNKIGLIVKREYLRRVSKKSFILITFLAPLLFAALVFVPLWLSGIKGDEVKKVAIIDTTGKYAPLFKNTDEYIFINSNGNLEQYRTAKDKEVFAFLNITGDLLENPNAATLYSEKQIPIGLKKEIDNVLSKYLKDEKLSSFNIPNLNKIIEESKINFDIKTIKWDAEGNEKSTSAEVASILGMMLTFIIYMFIMMYGAMVMQGVMEEKTNRIIEVIISSVKPFDLMMGKIIGIGFVGLTQVFLWGILTTVLVSGTLFFMGGSTTPEDLMNTQMAAQNLGNISMTAQAPEMNTKVLEIINSINFTQIGICFILYFIGGYTLYAALFAAIGSALEQQEDTQQFMMPILVLMIFSLYAGIYSMNNPDGPLAVWCSFIPFTSPIVMMVRLPYDIPIWEILISVSLLFATALLIVWGSAKIYRVGILMYGKKPSIREMFKWIKYK
ncbi:ABC transporter permease [Parabacteroides bouchesdurhonensis]|uniref:ABC transporter permease n=1 Tax=Parabacteroides bouchesdurhonensis TaxID=1936995 RepID=UPI000E4F35B8|nr:ABC transporter permease [Parabacteroides bouchesdurhonensis]RHJ92495.1 ABC transporter permease [Bacteroides sp. AM07-16]